MASTKASSLAEMIALNSDATGHYVNPVPSPEPGCMVGEICTAEQLAVDEMGVWRQALADELPRGNGLVCRDSTPEDGHAADAACDGAGGLVVKIFWLETRHKNNEDGGLRRLVARLPL